MENPSYEEFFSQFEDMVDTIEVLAKSVLRGNRFTRAEAVAFTLNELGDDYLHSDPLLALCGYVHLIDLLDDSSHSEEFRKQLISAFRSYIGRFDVTAEELHNLILKTLRIVGEDVLADEFDQMYHRTMGEQLFLGQLMYAN